MKSKLDSALVYLSKLPPAVSGAGGHDATFRAACKCFELGLDRSEVDEAMRWYNDNKCSPKWGEKELGHKINDAARHARVTSRPERGRAKFTPPSAPKPNNTPIALRSVQEEEAWWARVWSERGLPDPATVTQEEFKRAVRSKTQ